MRAALRGLWNLARSTPTPAARPGPPHAGCAAWGSCGAWRGAAPQAALLCGTRVHACTAASCPVTGAPRAQVQLCQRIWSGSALVKVNLLSGHRSRPADAPLARGAGAAGPALREVLGAPGAAPPVCDAGDAGALHRAAALARMHAHGFRGRCGAAAAALVCMLRHGCSMRAWLLWLLRLRWSQRGRLAGGSGWACARCAPRAAAGMPAGGTHLLCTAGSEQHAPARRRSWRAAGASRPPSSTTARPPTSGPPRSPRRCAPGPAGSRRCS